MKIKSFMLNLFSITVLMSYVGCSEIKIYEVNPPEDLQDKIDQIAEEKRQNQVEGEEELTITTTIAGNEDCSTAWWSAFSDSFRIPAGKLLTLEFVNHGSGVNNWNNYNLCVTGPADRDADGYFEYFVLRSDSYGWGNSDFNLAMISHNYADFDRDADDDFWDDFLELMQGAYVKMKVDHSKTGNVFVHIECTSADGTAVLIQEYQQPVSATEDIKAFLVCDASWFEMKRAVLTASEVESVDDQLPVSIEASGYPAFVEIGSEDVWGDATAVVTFEDGSIKTVGKDDVTLTVPDLSTVGEKTIIYSYSKSKLGEYCPSVAGFYTIKVLNPVAKLEITKMPDWNDYWVFDKEVLFSTAGMEVTATYVDGSVGLIPLANLEYSMVPATEGDAEVTVTYHNTNSTVSTTVPVTVKKGIADLGLNDCSTPWWTALSENTVVPSGESATVKMRLYSNNVSNWCSPCVVLRRMDNSEWGVLRMDNWGWGDIEGSWTAELDWNFETMASNLNGSEIAITVKNNGDDTCDVCYDVVYANGETHFQKYLGISIAADNFQFCLVSEGSYLVFHE